MTVNRLELASRTHVGLVRESNEDALLSSEALGIVLVADGMGGHRAGEVAADIGPGLAKAALAGRINGKLVDTSVESG